MFMENEDTRHDLFKLQSYIESNDISYMFLPPNVAEVFTKTYEGSSLKYLRVAGGRLKSCGEPSGRYEILYSLGMSENGGSVTFKPIRRAMSGDIPIGTAWNQTEIYLVGEMLRTSFVRDDEGVIWQEVADHAEIAITLAQSFDDEHIAIEPFSGELFRLILYQNELVVIFHHAILDGLSINVILRELFSKDVPTQKSSPFRYYI